MKFITLLFLMISRAIIKVKVLFRLTLCFSVIYASTAMGDCIKGDCTNGQGTYTYPDGSVYVGQWKDDKFNGQGTFTYSDGSVFCKDTNSVTPKACFCNEIV